MSSGDGVVITSREIYDAVQECTSKLDTVIRHQEQLTGLVADHEARLRGLERARWPLPSLAAVVSIIALILGAAPYFHG